MDDDYDIIRLLNVIKQDQWKEGECIKCDWDCLKISFVRLWLNDWKINDYNVMVWYLILNVSLP